MGGVAKHLMHLHEDRELTFNKIKKILSMASSGELVGTEKTDGFNIYLGIKSESDRLGVWFPAWARNAGDMKLGGKSFAQLAAREFAGGDKIKKTYLDAFKTYETALKSLSQSEIDTIFGENREIFYNAEIQGPSAKNVINYDEDIISIHRLGHKFYNKKTESLETIDTAANSGLLDRIVDSFEETTASMPFSVRRTAFLKLNQLDNDYDLNIALQKMQKAGFSGSMTIEEYLETYLHGIANRKLNFLSPDIQQDVIDRVLKKEGSKNLPQIYKGFPVDVKERIKQFVVLASEGTSSYIKDAIWPIEVAIHEFAVELLKGLKSAYILNNEAELTNFKNEVEKAIRRMERYQGQYADEIHEMLAKELLKLKHHDQITTVVEGFVFQVDDQMYKFTGNFAPINQLLGLLKWGRGKIPSMATLEKGKDSEAVVTSSEAPSSKKLEPEEVEESVENANAILDIDHDISQHDSIALIPGGFKPPHRGHLDLIRAASAMADMVYVFTGTKSRPLGNGEVTLELAQQIWGMYFEDANIGPNVLIVPVKGNPMKVAYNILEKKTVSGQTVFLATCDKDQGRFTDEIKKWAPPGVTVEPLVCVSTKHSKTKEALSATFMRGYLQSGNFEEFKEYVPKDSKHRAEEIWTLLRSAAKAGNNVPGDQKKRIKESSSISDVFSYINGVIEEIIRKKEKQFCLYSENLEENEDAASAADAEAVTPPEAYDNMRWADALNMDHKKMMNIKQWIDKLRKKRKKLEEAAMAAGSVEGSSIIKKKKSLIREDEPLLPEDDPRLIPLTGGLGIPRLEMPQIRSFHVEDFRNWLESKGIQSKQRNAVVKKLKPIQNAVNREKVDSVKQRGITNKPAIISKDFYLLDGHHRWYALREDDPEALILTIVIDLPMRELLKLIKSYPHVEYKDIAEQVIQKIVNYLLERYSSAFALTKKEKVVNEKTTIH